MTNLPPALGPFDDPLFHQPVRRADGSEFTVAGFLEGLQAHTDKLLREAAQAQQALDRAAGEATRGCVRLRVDAAGQITDLGFSGEMATTSPVSISRQFTQAFTAASRDANRALSTWMGGDIGTAIRDLAPSTDDEATLRAEAQAEEVAPLPAAEAIPMPADPVLDKWMAILDEEEDFTTALEKMRDTMPFSLPDFSLSGPEIDAQIAAENQRTSDAIVACQADLQKVRGVAEAKACSIEVNAAGVVQSANFKPAAHQLSPEELRTLVLDLVAEASRDARAQMTALLGDLADTDSFSLFHPTTQE